MRRFRLKPHPPFPCSGTMRLYGKWSHLDQPVKVLAETPRSYIIEAVVPDTVVPPIGSRIQPGTSWQVSKLAITFPEDIKHEN